MKKEAEILKTIDRKKTVIDCRGHQLVLGDNTLIMGILNVTPDSFSDGGKFNRIEAALARAQKLIEEGADIIDIGGESTRPGYTEISAQEEWLRLEPVIKLLITYTSVPISVDTQKAEVAYKALEAGAHIINDIWGLQKDPEMANTAAHFGAPVIIMHNKNEAKYQDLWTEMCDFFYESMEIALRKGINENQIILDPGIGFGKTGDHNLEILSRLEELKNLGRPVLLGASRKSVIGKALGLPVEERLEPTIAISVLGVAAGVDILRVHDVKENKKAVMMADEIIRRKEERQYENK